MVSNSRQNVQSVNRVQIKFASEKSVNGYSFGITYGVESVATLSQVHFKETSRVESFGLD